VINLFISTSQFHGWNSFENLLVKQFGKSCLFGIGSTGCASRTGAPGTGSATAGSRTEDVMETS